LHQNCSLDKLLREQEGKLSYPPRCKRISGKPLRRRIYRLACLERPGESRCTSRLHPHQPHAAPEPARQPADQAAAADGDQERVELGHLGKQPQPYGSLPQDGFHLIESVQRQGAGGLLPRFTRCQGIGIALALYDKLGPVVADKLLLRRGGNPRNEDPRGNLQGAGGTSYCGAVIAARGSDDPRWRNSPQQQIGKSSPGLKGAGALQELQFQGKRTAAEVEVGGVDLYHRCT